MEDINALSLLRQEIENVQVLSNPPMDFEDETELDVFENNCISVIHHAVDTITLIAKYVKEIDRQMEQLRLTLNNSTQIVQERLSDTLNSINIRKEQSKQSDNTRQKDNLLKPNSTEKRPRFEMKNEPTTPKEARNLDAKKMEFALRLQKIEKLKQTIQESILITQKIMGDIDERMGATMQDVEKLKDSIDGWMTTEKDKNKEEQRQRQNNKEQGVKEEKKINAEDDKKRRKKEEQEQKEDEERKRRGKKEQKRKEEAERRLKEEEERKIKEEEERNRKVEEERRKRAEDERLRQEEEDRKRKEEEERKLKEEEERRQREDDEKRRKKEEEERQRQEKERLKREEEERLRTEEIERKRIEEENKKRDPATWKPISYKRSEQETNAFHRGVCCKVAAMDGTLVEEELECLASDEWREDDNPSVLNMDEKLASSMISIEAKSGEKTFPVPMRVYAPHCSISDSSDEIVVKMSIDGGEWTEQRPVIVPPPQINQQGLYYAGIDVCKFKTVKMLAVAKTRSQKFIVDQGGINQVSTVDKNIKLFVPRDTFSKPSKLQLEVRQMREQSLAFATQCYEHCHNVLSTSSVMKITSETPTDKNIELDLTRNTRNDKKSRDKGKYLHVYKCRGDNWKIADSEFKGRNMDVSVTLPSRKEQYVVMEIEGRPNVPNDEFLKAADELYFHSNASIVRVIAKQRADNPDIMMIQCVARERVASRISELEVLGYSLGPDTSKEFPLLDGQGIILDCSGNITMASGSEVKLIFHSYMDTAKHEVCLQVVDEYKQKDMDVYLGILQFEVLKDKREGNFYNKTKGSLPLTLPKIVRVREQKRKARIQIHFPHYLTALAKFLAKNLTTQSKDNTWLQVIYSLDSRREMNNISRRAATRCEVANNDRQMCEIILQDWMKSKPIMDDKIKTILWALRNCQMLILADECEKFVSIHMEYCSDSHMSEMAKKVEGDWTSLALTLGLSKEDIDACKSDGRDSNEEAAFMVLCKWRVSEAAINSGLDVYNDLLGRLETTQSNTGLKEYVRHLQNQMS